MISRLTGTLLEKTPPLMVIDVSGVGYELEAPMSTFYQLPAVGQKLSIHTYLAIREDAHLLYGFASIPEKNLFKTLIKLTGIGPKIGLAVLSSLTVTDFWDSVRNNETGRLTKIPGVGKKTAERMVLELRDKAGVAAPVQGVSAHFAGVEFNCESEARAALESLGYKPAESQKLVDAVKQDGMSTDQLIREALKRAVR